ncbi:MAG: TcpD family membrane protein [Enterococcus casseliflavus]
MGLKQLSDFILEQGKYAIIMLVVYLASKNFAKSKVVQIISAFVGGAITYFFLNDPEKVFDGMGTIIEKLFGG